VRCGAGVQAERMLCQHVGACSRCPPSQIALLPAEIFPDPDPFRSPSTNRMQVRTVHIAETMLPTRHGNFRLRGYKHSVS